MKVTKVRLRNIGYRYVIELENEVIEIIDFLNGRKEIYKVKNGKVINLLNLGEEEAKEIGLILAGLRDVDYDLTPVVRDKVLMDWVVIKKDFFAVNKPIKELKIRTKTGATIVAIDRNGKVISNITPETVLKEGDKVLVIGPLHSIEKAKLILLKGDKND